MNRALRRVSLRFLFRHPWQFGLAVVGIALGVAVVVAVDLTNASAQRALGLSVEQVSGRATHTLSGSGAGIPETLYRQMRVEWGYSRAAPRVEGFAEIGGEVFELLGVDPFAEQPFQRAGNLLFASGAIGELLTRSGAFLASEGARRRLGAGIGESLTATIGGREQTVSLVGISPSEDGRLSNLLVFDISSAQELLGLKGVIHAVDLVLTASEARELEARLPPGIHLDSTTERASELDALTRGFRHNLTALSLLALIVGGFLIYNTMTFSVVQRRDLFGLLRAVGATRGQILVALAFEVVSIGLLGTVLGLLFGLLLAQGLIHLVTRTINDLYYVLTVREFFLDGMTLLKGLALGLVVSLGSALFPALEAARAPPHVAMTRSAQESRVRRIVPRLGLAGALLAALAALWVHQSATLIESYLGLFALVLGVAMVTPFLASFVLQRLTPLLPAHGSAVARLAIRGVEASLSRTTTAIVALMIAIAVSLGMGVMVNSFRVTVADWLGYHLQADLFLSVPGHFTRRSSTPLSEKVIESVRRDARVAHVATWRGLEVESDRGSVRLSVLSPAPRSRLGYRLLSGSAERAWQAAQRDSVLISESFAFRHRLAVGDELMLLTEGGRHRFPIAGVYSDYGNDRGTVLMLREVFDRFWSDRTVSALGIYLREKVDASEVLRDLRSSLVGEQRIRLRSNRELRDASLAIFDRTFTITYVLRLLAMGAAFIAVVSTLMAVQLERSREFAIFRATGMTPGQLWQLMLGQTLLIGGIATLFALAVGFALAWILIEVVNRHAFGWSIAWHVAPVDLLGVCLLGVSAALLAALYPAWRAAGTPPALALRDE
ncbi:MAG: FtsX-like permease family protein [Gammaproteobacteria bacterium]